MSITKISPDVVDFDAGITISTTDNTSNLILTSTDADANTGPILELYRNSSSPADNDEIGRIYFYGENDNDEKIEYGLIRGTIVDASDGTEDSALQIYTYSGGGQRNRIDLLAGETVFNEGSQDLDFRVESNTLQYALFVDGGNDVVGIGTSVPASYHANANNLVIYEAGNAGITIATGSSNYGSIFFGDGTSGSEPYTGYLQYGHNSVTSGYNDVMTIGTGATQRIGIGAYGISFGSGTHTAARGLDDYEEGTFTPTYTGSSSSGSQAYSYQNGFYIKVGSLVTCFVDMNITSSSGMSGTSMINLPFPSVNANWYAPFVPWEVSTAFTDSDQKAIGFVVTNSSTMSMYKYESLNSNVQSSGYFNQNVTGRISGQFTYQAA